MKPDPQTTLMINTASDPATIGFQGSFKNVASERAVSTQLLRQIDVLLHHCGTELEDVSAIAVTIGPGSFTSLRIGIAAANALAWTRSLPVIEVDKESAASPELFQAFVRQACRDRRFVKSAMPNYGRPPSITPLPNGS